MLLLSLIMLPAVVSGLSGRITITITASQDKSLCAVEYLGNVMEIMPEDDSKSWGLDHELKNIVLAYSGVRPESAYLHEPTPWGLYNNYGWKPVHRTVTPIKATILSLESTPTILFVDSIAYDAPGKYKYDTNRKGKAEKIVTSSWNKSVELKVGREINHKVSFVDDKCAMIYAESWGKDATHKREMTVYPSMSTVVELTRGQELRAQMTATAHTLVVGVRYQATVDGRVACNFGAGKYKGHHFYGWDVNDLLRAASLPTTKEATETIKIEFFTGAKFVAMEEKENKLLFQSGAKFITQERSYSWSLGQAVQDDPGKWNNVADRAGREDAWGLLAYIVLTWLITT